MTGALDPRHVPTVLNAVALVTTALGGDDEALGRLAVQVLTDVDGRARSSAERTYWRSMLLARVAEIAALALTQWAADQPEAANEWLQLQAARFEADMTELLSRS